MDYKILKKLGVRWVKTRQHGVDWCQARESGPQPKGPIMNVTDLRKAFTAQGIKGFSSANRATFTAAIEAAEVAAYAEDAARKPVAAPVAKKGSCNVCGKRRAAKNLNGQCEPCFEEGGWENTHNDSNHEGDEGDAADREDCWICHPELNRAQAEPKAGRSRAGMVILAKGSEVHKSQTFKVHAEISAWTVQILGSVIGDGGEGDGEERWVAIARRGDDVIELAWNGRAYDYHSSSAFLNGKSRKVRNLKEATRLLVA